jgi:hypothetical protein
VEQYPADQPTELLLWPAQKATGEIRRKWEDVFRVFESALKSRLETGSWLPGMMSMRDNVLPRQRILELYLRTAVQKRHARFSAVSPCIFCHKPAISIIKALKKGQSRPTERFVQPPKSEKATSDSWNLTRLLKAIPQDSRVRTPLLPTIQTNCTRVVRGAGSFGQVESA